MATGHGSCRGSASTTVTVTGPQVSITSPSAGATYLPPASVTIEASATDTGNSTITRVEFYVGSTLLGTDTSAPYAFTWNGVGLGSYTLTAKAFNAGNVSAVSGGVSVAVINLAGVSITPATVADNEPATITVTGANPCDALHFSFGDGTWQVFPISAPPYSTSRAWSAGGPKTVIVTGQGSCSGQVHGTVQVTANAPPVVALTSPLSGTGYAGLATVELAATASDSDGTIDRVEFYAGTALISTDTTAPYAFTWSNVQDGTYSITAHAVDNLGRRGISSTALITISKRVTGVSVSPAAVVTGQAATVMVTGSYAYARNNPLKFTDPTGTTYEICGYNETGGISSCGSVSDEYFGSLSRTASGHSMRLWGGTIFVGDRAVGSYRQTSVDATFNSFINQTGQLADRWLKESLTDMAVGSAFAATGGLAAGAFSGGLATSEVFGIGRIAVGVRPSPGQIAQMQQVFARQGCAGVEKALRSFERRLAEHLSKIDAMKSGGGYTSSLEREVQNFRELIAAAKQLLGK